MDESPASSWRSVVDGLVPAVCTARGDQLLPVRVLFPGAFNPAHSGHWGMLACARRWLDQPVEMEISVTNVDKPNLTVDEVQRRLDQFPTSQIVWVTRAPTFPEKSALFPSVTFVVGADTITRIADPAYYGNDRGQRDEAIARMQHHQCKFLVFGRLDSARFGTLANTELPVSLLELCQQVPEVDFRDDISSREILREQDDLESLRG